MIFDMTQGKSNDGIGDEAMVELNQDDVVDEVLDLGRNREQRRDRWNEIAIHQRPGVVGQPGLRSRDKAAERNLEQDQADKDARRYAGTHFRRGSGAVFEPGGHPDQAGQDDAGDRKVQGEFDGGDGGHARLQARGHHDPADSTLQASQGADAEKGESKLALDRPSCPKPDQRQKED